MPEPDADSASPDQESLDCEADPTLEGGPETCTADYPWNGENVPGHEPLSEEDRKESETPFPAQ